MTADDLLDAALLILRANEPDLAAGMTDGELDATERRFGFRFCRSHRALLHATLPVGPGWVDWRSAEEPDLKRRLAGPVDGVVFDVHHAGFWPASWGVRPEDQAAAENRARVALSHVPRLVPIFGHRYLPAAPAPEPTPVLSVHQTDVIYYGRDLVGYLPHELTPREPRALTTSPARVEFWTDLALGADNLDL